MTHLGEGLIAAHEPWWSGGPESLDNLLPNPSFAEEITDWLPVGNKTTTRVESSGRHAMRLAWETGANAALYGRLPITMPGPGRYLFSAIVSQSFADTGFTFMQSGGSFTGSTAIGNRNFDTTTEYGAGGSRRIWAITHVVETDLVGNFEIAHSGTRTLGDYIDVHSVQLLKLGDADTVPTPLASLDSLKDYLRAIGTMYEQVELFSEEDELHEGWEILLDPDRCPAYVLPYLAQFIGEQLPQGLETSNEALAREYIKDEANSRRGTLESIIRTAQRTLTGSRIVVVYEREPDEDSIVVNTVTSETPDTGQVLADLRALACPADIVLSYAAIAGATYIQLEADPDADTYNEMLATWPNYNAVAAEVPVPTVYTRPPA